MTSLFNRYRILDLIHIFATLRPFLEEIVNSQHPLAYRFFTLPTASPDLRLYVSSEMYSCTVWPPSVIDRYQPPLLSLLHSHAAPYPRVSFGAMQFQRPVLYYLIRTHNTLEDCQIYELGSSYSEFQHLYLTFMSCPRILALRSSARHDSTRLHCAGQHLHLLSSELSSAPLPPPPPPLDPLL